MLMASRSPLQKLPEASGTPDRDTTEWLFNSSSAVFAQHREVKRELSTGSSGEGQANDPGEEDASPEVHSAVGNNRQSETADDLTARLESEGLKYGC